MDAALGSLRVVAVLEVKSSHTVQPRLPQLWGVAVGLGQAVVEVHHLLWVILVNLLWGGGESVRVMGEERDILQSAQHINVM